LRLKKKKLEGGETRMGEPRSRFLHADQKRVAQNPAPSRLAPVKSRPQTDLAKRKTGAEKKGPWKKRSSDTIRGKK